MSLKFHSCIFLMLVLGRTAVADKCPPSEAISPCTCQNVKNDAYMTCGGLQNSGELEKALAATKPFKIHCLYVMGSFLGDVPGDLFKDTHFREIEFSYSKMTSIGDKKNPPFSGLEDILKRLTIIEGFWDYEKPLTKPIRLDHLKKLEFLNFENNIIPKIGNDWFQNGPFTLKDLYFTNALAKEMDDKVFAKLKNLRGLYFHGNSVTPKRSALPSPAPVLDTLVLSDNKILDLPSDIFTNFPVLKNVYLDGNALGSMPESTWKSILPQLDSVSLKYNPLLCDSKMKWIIDAKLNGKIIGQCAGPEAFRGKEISSLTAGDFSG